MKGVRTTVECNPFRKGLCNSWAVAAALFCSFAGTNVYAADINGAWTMDRSSCSKSFDKDRDKITIYGRGFVVDSKEIRGRSVTCQITNRKDDNQFVRLVVDCPSEIAENFLTLRIDGPDQVTRIFPGLAAMNRTYFRCRL